MRGRIWFEGNPWPGGHAVSDFAFEVLLDDSGPRLLLHLQSEDYDAHDDPDADEDEATGDWLSKGVWGNYHACILSNTYWGIRAAAAPLLATPVAAAPAMIAITADPVTFGSSSSIDWDDHAFHIYLLGHDSVHAHDIHIVRGTSGLYDVNWSGLVALTYAGDDVFKHRFRAEIREVEFGGFRIENPTPNVDPRLPQRSEPVPPSHEAREARARALAARFVAGGDALAFHAGLGFEADFLRSR